MSEVKKVKLIRDYPSYAYYAICPYCRYKNWVKKGWAVMSIKCKNCGAVLSVEEVRKVNKRRCAQCVHWLRRPSSVKSMCLIFDSEMSKVSVCPTYPSRGLCLLHEQSVSEDETCGDWEFRTEEEK